MFGQRHLRLGGLRQFSFSQALRQPEVRHLDLAFGRHLDVGRLQVPMDYSLIILGRMNFPP